MRGGDCYWYTVTSPLLKPLKQHLIDVTSFRLSKSLYSQSVPFKRTNNLGYALPNLLYRRICEIKFPTDVSFYFFLSIFCFSYQFKVTFDAQNLPFIRHCSQVINLPSPVYCTSRKVERNFTPQSKVPLGSSLLRDVTDPRLIVTDVSGQSIGSIF